ncbi:MAG: MobA/MobL family protein [Rhodospirillaceae bacterium]|nr:MobA/MobL family protein [Rhodospirillaceae bacterium]
MAIYHLSVKTVKRSTGRSAVAAAAYRTATKLVDDRTGQTYDYTRKQGVEFSEIIIPETVPLNLSERNALWDSAEAAEMRKNSVTAREYEIALPAEFDGEQRKACVHEFSRWLVDRFGVAVDAAIHAPHRDGDQRNYHAHILTTTRVIDGEGIGQKTRELDEKKSGAVVEVREKWADIANRHLERAQVTDRIDHRSHKDRGIDAAPTFHIGVKAAAMERRGIETDRGNRLRLIVAANKAVQIARLAHLAVSHQVKQVARKSMEALSAAGGILLNRKTKQAQNVPVKSKSRMKSGLER